MSNETSPPRSERIQVQLSQDELTILDEWRFTNRIPSRAAAIRELLRVGLGGRDQERSNTGTKSADYGLRNKD